MITEFGKALRTIRIEHDEILKDMAAHLGVTASFLSSVEIGKKNVPASWVARISEVYGLSEQEKIELQVKANDSANAVKLTLFGSSQKQRDMALVLARSFNDISDETATKILDFMKKERKGR